MEADAVVIMAEVEVVDEVATKEEAGAAAEDEAAEEDTEIITTATDPAHHKGQMIVVLKNSKNNMRFSELLRSHNWIDSQFLSTVRIRRLVAGGLTEMEQDRKKFG